MEEPKIIRDYRDFMIVYKPSGWLTVGRGGRWSSLEEWLRDKAGAKPGVLRSGVVHRLDRETSGGIVVAKSQEAFDFYQGQFKRKNVTKFYWCLVSGRTSGWGKIEMPLTIMNRGGVVKRKVGAEGKMAISEFWREKVGKRNGREYSWLKVRIYTGRTHQIRVHLAYLGWPIVGDGWYGKEAEKRMMLHEGYLGLVTSWGEAVEAEIGLPEEMKTILVNNYEIEV